MDLLHLIEKYSKRIGLSLRVRWLTPYFILYGIIL